MAMSIDEATLTIKNAKRFTYDDIYEEAFDMAIDTLRKYQKIQEIVNAEFEEYNPLDRNIYRLALIRKVIEDGME